MKTTRFSGGTASSAAVVAYVLMYVLRLPPFTYAALEGAWHLGRYGQGAPMYWFGYVAGAAVAGAAAGFLLPEPRSSRAWNLVLVFLPLAAAALIAFHERRWFLRP